jgi:acetyl-CoA acetyltransferase
MTIAGVGQTEITRGSDKSPVRLARDAAVLALTDADMAADEVDGIIAVGGDFDNEAVCAAVGIASPRFSTSLNLGGASAVAALGVAALAVAGGGANAVLVVLGRNGFSQRRIDSRVKTLPGAPFKEAFERPFGWSVPAHWYALMCRAHMERYGTSREDLGAVAVTMRDHAQLNPQAMMFGRPLSYEQYAASGMIADPYLKYDCCLESDGGAAILVTRGSGYTDSRRISMLSVAQGQPDSPDNLAGRSDLLQTGLERAAPRAFRESGLTPADVDCALIYDCFTFELLHQLEAAGFCAPGESGDFVKDGGIGLRGRLPVNPHGGLLSEGHLGGMNHIVEAVRQLRGECGERQVPDCEVAAVTGWGNLGDGSIALLSR